MKYAKEPKDSVEVLQFILPNNENAQRLSPKVESKCLVSKGKNHYSLKDFRRKWNIEIGN